MECDDRRDNLVLYALGSLDGPDLHDLRAHLDGGCIVCAEYLARQHEVLSLLPLSLPVNIAPVDTKRQLMQRVQDSAMRITASDPAAEERQPARGSWLIPLMGAAMAACLCLVIALIVILFNQDKTIDAYVRRTSQKDEQIQILQSQVVNQGAIIHLVDSPSTLMVKLEGTEKQPNASGKLMWDPVTRMARLDTMGMQALPADKMYELWLVNDQQAKIPAGMFSVNSAGIATLTSTVQVPGKVMLVAVTDEPAAGMPQPTGNFQLIGKMK